MRALDRIITHLNHHQGRAFCDDCPSKTLSIRPRQAAQQKTFKLAKAPDTILIAFPGVLRCVTRLLVPCRRRLETIAASKPSSRMADHWTEQLRCPTCHRTGSASLSQEDDDDIPTADNVPDGFELITTRYGIDFICSSCRIRVEP